MRMRQEIILQMETTKEEKKETLERETTINITTISSPPLSTFPSQY
jgi:hypothetical protein